MPPPADQPLRHRKTRDRAMALPLLGFVLLLPPLGRLFDIDGQIAGVPVTLVYVFAVWTLLIVAGAALAPRLREAEDPPPPPPPTPPC